MRITAAGQSQDSRHHFGSYLALGSILHNVSAFRYTWATQANHTVQRGLTASCHWIFTYSGENYGIISRLA
jgi:hypothetical protein